MTEPVRASPPRLFRVTRRGVGVEGSSARERPLAEGGRRPAHRVAFGHVIGFETANPRTAESGPRRTDARHPRVRCRGAAGRRPGVRSAWRACSFVAGRRWRLGSGRCCGRHAAARDGAGRGRRRRVVGRRERHARAAPRERHMVGSRGDRQRAVAGHRARGRRRPWHRHGGVVRPGGSVTTVATWPAAAATPSLSTSGSSRRARWRSRRWSSPSSRSTPRARL